MANDFIMGLKTASALFMIMLCSQLQLSAQEMLWGITAEGGASGAGAIFKTNADGTNLEVKKSLTTISGRTPLFTKLVQANDGKLYGMTSQGGGSLKGVLFEYDPVSLAYAVLVNFDGTASGGYPYGSLTQCTNGKLYGMTSEGGVNNKGVIFEYDPVAHVFSKKHDFSGIGGETPYGDLAESSDGILYGVTFQGGTNNFGVLFKYDPEIGVFTKQKDFDGTAGINPFGGLMTRPNGKLYGMANGGGVFSKGTIYEYDPSVNVMTKRFDFEGAASGAFPTGSLMEANNGRLYGLTPSGGSIDSGVLFEFDPSNGNFSKKIDFDGGTKGLTPFGTLLQASNGKLYGTTEQGLTNYGGMFEYNLTTGSLLTVVTFDGNTNGKGAFSRATLLQAIDGNLYGMTSSGGMGSDGVLFSYNPATSGYQVKLNFNVGQEGSFAFNNLVQGSNGKIYGTTYLGGDNLGGILFEYDITLSVFKKKLDFTPSTGVNPVGGLTLAANGKLYGVTRFGGAFSAGVVFEYDPSGNLYAAKASFSTALGSPVGRLVQVPNGKIYGVTDHGGNNNLGTLFEFDPVTNNLIKKVDFAGSSNGAVPAGTLLHFDAKLYGLTSEGGVNGLGVLYEYDPTSNTLTVKQHFNGALAGTKPVGGLIKAMNNKFYGVTSMGGVFNWGVIFEYDPTAGDFAKLFDFTGDFIDGVTVLGGLAESSSGKLYGTTEQGGTDGWGVLYEFDIENKLYTKKADFNGANGARPIDGPLLFVSMQNQSVTFDELESKTTTDGTFELSASATSGLAVTYTSSNPNVATIAGTTVAIKGAGTTSIIAEQTGGINYHPSPSIARTLTVTMIVATEEPLELGTLPYPNPASNDFVIELDYTGGTTESLQLFDMIGRSRFINAEKLEGKKYKCQINEVPPGLYFLAIPNTDKSWSIMISR